MAERVKIVEVGPRDGLQNEAGVISVGDKLALIGACVDAGLDHVEVGSFVSPKWVPQMADSDKVVQGLRAGSAQYAVLVPNMRGLQALEAMPEGVVREVAVFVSASEGFSQSNLNCSIDESFERLIPVIDRLKGSDYAIRGYVSCIVDCPFDGPTPAQSVADVAQRLSALGCDEISLGDTLGKGAPERVSMMLDAVLQRVDVARVAGHFHDTGGRALENVDVSLAKGVRIFDSAVGGLGGCPYAPGAPGNLATEALVAHLHGLGFETGVDTSKLATAAALAKGMRDAHH